MALLDRLGNLSYDPLTALASGLLQASGPSRTPVGLGQAFGVGLEKMGEAERLRAQRRLTEARAAELEAEQARRQRLGEFVEGLGPQSRQLTPDERTAVSTRALVGQPPDMVGPRHQDVRAAVPESVSQPGPLGLTAGQAEFARQQPELFAAAYAKRMFEPSSAPETKIFYDDEGREYRAQWDPRTRRWQRVGGAKAPSRTSFEKTLAAYRRSLRERGADDPNTKMLRKRLDKLTAASDGAVTSFDSYQNVTDRELKVLGQSVPPGGTVTLDERDPREARALRRHRTALRPAPRREERGQPGAFEPRAREVETLTNVEIQTRNFLDTSNELITRIADNPQALGAVGRVSQAVNALAATAEGVRNVLFQAAPPNRRDEAAYVIERDGRRQPATPREVKRAAIERVGGDFFDALTGSLGANLGRSAVDASVVQSMVVDLAFAAAAASGQTGRAVSDRDVERFLRQIGQSADPAVFTAVLRDVQRRLVRNYENVGRALNRRLPEGGKLDLAPVRDEYLGGSAPRPSEAGDRSAQPSAGSAASEPPLPSELPAGSRRVGTTATGLPVYETPDGRRLVVE